LPSGILAFGGFLRLFISAGNGRIQIQEELSARLGPNALDDDCSSRLAHCSTVGSRGRGASHLAPPIAGWEKAGQLVFAGPQTSRRTRSRI
jgi:hypothetical protein